MATFEAQVEALTSLSIDGSSAPTQTELTQFLTDGAKEILNALPSSKKILFTTSNDLNSSSVNLTLGGSKVYGVTRDDGTINQPCREIPHQLSGRARDSSDMSAATATDPVYYVSNNILSVIPEPSNSNNAHVHTIAYPAVAYGDSSITKFPDDAEYLVPIYGAVKSLQNVLANKTSNSSITTALTAIKTEMDETQAVCDKIDADLVLAKAEIVLAKAEATELATQTDNSGDFETACDAMVTELNKVDEIILLAHEEFDEVAAEVSSTATSPITSARSAAPSALSISDLTISVSAPSAPSLGTIEYPEATNSDASASSIGAITVATVSKADISGNAPTYSKPTLTTRVSFEDFFSTSEDGNPFGDSDPGVFSLSTPPALGTASFTVPEISAITIDSFGTAPVYTAPKVAGATEELTAEITAGAKANAGDQTDVSDWWDVLADMIETDEDTELANAQLQKINSYINAYQSALQNQLNIFNDANVEYQATIKKEIEQSRLDATDAQQEASLKLQKEVQEYQAKVSEYQAEVNTDVQVYSKKLDRYQSEVNTAFQAWSKTESDSLQQYQIDIQNELNEYNKENVIYQANIKAELAKHNSDLQKALNQAKLDAEDAQKEAQLTTDVDKFNKAQDQVLALTNASKEMEDIVLNNKSLMEKFTGELNKYTAQVNDEVQEYQANLRQKVEEFDSSIKLQGTYFKEAESRLSAGDAFLKQAQSTVAQAQGYANEVSARANFSGAKSQAIQGFISTAQSYITSAQGFGNEIQAKINIAQGYSNEVQARLTVDTSHYGWYEKQQAKLQADYDKGLQIIMGVSS